MAKPHFTRNAFACFKNVCSLNDYDVFEQNKYFSTKHMMVIYHWHDVSTNRTFEMSLGHDGFPKVEAV